MTTSRWYIGGLLAGKIPAGERGELLIEPEELALVTEGGGGGPRLL